MMADSFERRLPPNPERLMEVLDRHGKLAEDIHRETGLPYITAFVMAGDRLSAERALRYVEDGTWDWQRGLTLTGSYARLDLARTLVEKGLMPREDLLKELPELWRGSDPDDTDVKWLLLWQEAWTHNGEQTIYDGATRLPEADYKAPIIVYRGQPDSADFGIAWSTSREIAEKFAGGAGLRVRTQGVTWRALVPRDKVIAYLTERGECEVIVDPKWATELTRVSP